jgi:hypothetical protein
LPVFYIDFAKVYWDIAHVAMAIHVCFECIFQMFYMYQTYVASFFHLYIAKVDLDVAYTCMLQAYILNVSGVTYVSCKCFIWMLHMFAINFKCFANVSDVCCNYFSCFRAYIASVLSGCYKSRTDVTHVVMGPTCCSYWVMSERRGPVAGAPTRERRRVREKPSLGMGPTWWGARKTDGASSFSCVCGIV